MSDTSRRKFLAAAGAGTVASAAVIGTTAGTAQAKPSATRATESVVALVEPASDTVRLLVGEREVIVQDRDLATRLLNAAGGN